MAFRADILEDKRKKRAKKRLYSSLWKFGVFFTLLSFCFFIFTYLFSGLPKVNSKQELWLANRANSLEIIDKNGNTIAIRGPRYGRMVAIDSLPQHVIKAFLAVEDARFFEHSGIDLIGIARALVENIVAGQTVQGASTITQQLVKNVYLTPEKSIKRKFQEIILAYQIDSKFPKKDILEAYLNRIYFGQNSYGIDAASWHYFSKSPKDLSLSEAAMLAGLPKAPGRLSSDLTSAPAIERRNIVLGRMVTAGFIKPDVAQSAMQEGVNILHPQEPKEGEMAYAIDMAAKEINNINPPIAPDRIARLTIDPNLQAKAVEAVNSILARSSGTGANQAALIAMDKSGRILAIVGGKSYAQSQFNRVTQAKRQPGSTFKPLVYAAALEKGLTPDTIRIDKPVSYNGWKPQNFGGGYRGAMTLSTALTRSVNTIAVQLGAEIGVEKLILTANRLGIDSPLPKELSISLGAGEVTLMDMTRSYGTFANDGVRIDPFLIERVDTTRNTIAYERQFDNPTQVYDPMRARQMTAMLSDVIEFGTGKHAKLKNNREAAGKTGTSQNYRDAWFIGYTGDIICGVWVGNDEFKPMNSITGGSLPADIWAQFMNEAHEGLPLKPLPTIYDINRPDNNTLALFYENLANLFSAAGGKTIATSKGHGQTNPPQLDRP